jgi:hypothetical protein
MRPNHKHLSDVDFIVLDVKIYGSAPNHGNVKE